MFATAVTRRVYLLAACALMPAAFATTPQQLAMEKEGVELIRQVEDTARKVRFNAGHLTAYGRSPKVAKSTHAFHLSEIRTLVNERLKPVMLRLDEIQPQLPDWKQQAIGKMIESARALAADTNNAIVNKTESGPLPPNMNAEYKALVAKIYEHSEALVKTSDAAGAYAASRLKAHQAGVKVPKM